MLSVCRDVIFPIILNHMRKIVSVFLSAKQELFELFTSRILIKNPLLMQIE